MPTIGNIKATFVGCDEIKQLFSNSSCVVAVSVGQKAHEGENFQATMALVNNYFSQCTVLVADSLQRHNLIFTQPQRNQSNNDYEESLFLGDQWLARNSDTLSNITIPHSIRRWDEWLKTNEFEIHFNKIKMCYEENAELREAVYFTIEEFIQRFCKRNENSKITREIIFNNSRNYLLEEIAILMLMFPKENYNYIIYPNKIIKALEVSHKTFVEKQYPNLLKWVHVQLKKKVLASRVSEHEINQLQPVL